ncbi:biotin-dependent carboxyltransferase family protein [Roseobacter litoralis]|uniref:5-oxoprolinase subunit C family protein n=1 Tax=Roseobacter litoralis TaxID=42443 RepID=UPI003CD0C821
MSGHLIIHTAGPGSSVQDMGRAGFLAYGLTRGGAADQIALHEAAALLGQSPTHAAIEMVGVGGTFESSVDTVIALTGAEMSASIDGSAVVWHASHSLPKGAKLKIGGVLKGTYGYLSVAGGIDTPQIMGARSTHFKAGIGDVLEPGQTLPLGAATTQRPGFLIAASDRFAGGDIRIVPSVQTDQFSPETLTRFAQTTFRRDARGNRQGVRMDAETDGFFVDGGLSIVSEVITEGDIQVTGDGAPYVLMCECQTTGGYPRIGTVLPCDLARVAQAPVGAPLRFRFVTVDEAREVEIKSRAEIKALAGRAKPLVRDPHDISDLLSYQLVSGAVSATTDPFAE